ncbi:MAG: DUF58 domain-containing protein [Planctomycetota bacterium]|nr:DUF58 domain-containing protein [Planctomycetota bacterium]
MSAAPMHFAEGYLEDFATLDARQFTIAIKKLATSLSYGIDRSPFLGSGTEFVQSRPYQPGDSVKSIDWRVTARTKQYHVKQYEAPKNVPCLLLLDTSASMTVGSTHQSKYALALFVAGGIALASLDRASPVGVIGVGERNLRVEPTLSRARALEWILRLRTFRFDEKTTLARRVTELAPTLRQRALVVVLSDLHDPEGSAALKKLAHVHDVVVLQFVDPAERGLRGSGFVRAREAETGREFVTFGKRTWLDEESVARACRSAGMDHLPIEIGRPYEVALRRLFKQRGFAARGTR